MQGPGQKAPIAEEISSSSPEIQRDYRLYLQQMSLRNAKVASVLVILLMPAGALLDLFVYPERIREFLGMRLMCSLVTGLTLWGLHSRRIPEQVKRRLTAVWYLVPAAAISWMIWKTEGANSPYYAGLNLVLLTVVAVMQSTLWESLLIATCIAGMYLAACFAHAGSIDWGIFFNNLYFLTLTIIVVLSGNYFLNRLRLNEFTLRRQIESNRRQLEENNTRLRELDRLKSDFFANISHELRTPLTLLLAPLEILLHSKKNILPKDAVDLLQPMHSNGLRLLKLINDLLDLVKLESGKMTLKESSISLPTYLAGLAGSVRNLAESKRIEINLLVDPALTAPVLLDADKLEKILLNLLINAIKFTQAGGQVSLQAALENGMLLLQVADNGKGIPEEHVPRIFERFWQGDSSSVRKHAGTGIGLALVKELTELQGGRIDVNSKVGQGTCISVRLPHHPGTQPLEQPLPAPAAPKPDASFETSQPQPEDRWIADLYHRAQLFPVAPATAPQSLPSPPSASPRRENAKPVLLIADDEPEMRRFIRSQLEERFSTLEARDGLEAVELARQYLPQIILLDMMMPEKDGLQVCGELRQITALAQVPIVLLTARADEQTRLACLAAGASDFLTKPFSLTELHLRLANHVAAHLSRRELARQNKVLEATIEKLKETELQLVQSEKMSSLGVMSAGIIHEINNPLNYAKTALHLLKQQKRTDAALAVEILADVEQGIDRVRDIVTSLRSFTHPHSLGSHDVPVREAVSLALKFLSHSWKEKIEVTADVPEDFTLRMDQNKLVQVLVNLLQNAIDAMATRRADDARPPALLIRGEWPADRTLLRIRDNGPGIPPEILPRIFDPFFTTKDVGQGMGLGLSICYRIVQEAGGIIRVDSTLGSHTEFILDFPRLEGQNVKT